MKLSLLIDRAARIAACAAMLLASGFASCYAQKNLSLLSNLPYAGVSLAGVWGHVDSLGNEYALVATSKGLSVTDVTNPAAPAEKFFISGSTSTWHEVKTWNNHAYVSSEGGGGIQIIDLSGLPGAVRDTVWRGDGAIAGLISSAHTLAAADGFLYVFGSNAGQGGAYVADLSDPWRPRYVGKRESPYVHDGFVRNDTLYACHINNGYFSVTDFRDKAAPVTLGTHSTPLKVTHNAGLSADGRTLFVTDEANYSSLTSYDVSDPANIAELDRVQATPGSGSVVHNTRIINDYSVTSWYHDGVAVVDVSRPANMIVTGYYDTNPASGAGMGGCWDVYPYLPSGNILATDILRGLFVLGPSYTRGCYLEGIVTDSASGAPLNNVSVKIAGTTEYSGLDGRYATGMADSGTYTVTFYTPSHYPETFTGVVLKNGQLTALNVALRATGEQPMALAGEVRAASTGFPVVQADVRISNAYITYDLKSAALGAFSVQGFYPGTYDIVAGKWGYVTVCLDSFAVDSTTGLLRLDLPSGLYDDFTFDFGWQVSGVATGGEWIRAVPALTLSDADTANPAADVPDDCSETCFVTGNGGGTAGDDDVDGARTVLTSPNLNLAGYTDPYISYYLWYYNSAATPSDRDTVLIRISDGTTTKLVERITGQASGWQYKSFRISDYLAPTAAMQFIVRTGDYDDSPHIHEVAVDLFHVFDSVPDGLAEARRPQGVLRAYPNPLSGGEVGYVLAGLKPSSPVRLTLSDATGRTVAFGESTGGNGVLRLPFSLDAGIYVLTARAEGQQYRTRIIKP